MWSSRGLSNAAIYSKVNFNLNYTHIFGTVVVVVVVVVVAVVIVVVVLMMYNR